MFSINFGKYNKTCDGAPVVSAIGAGYGEAILSRLSRQPNGGYTGSMSYMAPAAVGYKGASKPVNVTAEIIEQARQVARAEKVTKIRWDGKKFFPQR